MPSILFINRVYPPDSGATGRVLEYMARGFVSAGWQVTVLCTAGSKTSAGASDRDGVRVVRSGGVFSKKNLLLRAMGYALMIPSLCLRALTLPRADVVVTMTDPPMLLVVGPLLSFFKGSRLIHWAQDLYPEVAEELGVFHRGGFAARLLSGISSSAMKHHERTIALGRCMKDRLLARGVAEDRIRIIPNTGVEQEIVAVSRTAREFRDRHGLGEAFIVQYSGNMGRAHEFETVIEAARLLQQQGVSDVLFLFVGGGPREDFVRDKAKHLELSNIRFLPSQPTALLSESLGAGDLHLVTMREGMEGLVVPSKFYGVMASERPSLYVGSANSEVAHVILEHGIGAVIRPGDAAALVGHILTYRDLPSRVDEEGKAARFALKEADAVQLFLGVATELVNRI